MIKRSFDLFFAFAGLLATLPLFAAITLWIGRSSPGPVFFCQQRVGRKGRIFRAVKFRTMYVGADRQGSVTAASDSRITPAGKFLRRLKLDELPQLWNVLVGNMSFVGPRPDVPGYADRLAGDERRILELRPGITGPATLFFRYEEELLAQVSDPKNFNDTVLWPVKVRMNLDYARNRNLLLDIGYILLTLWPGLNRTFKLIPEPPRSCGELVSNPRHPE